MQSLGFVRASLVAVLLVFLALPADSYGVRLFQVGNSFTFDTQPTGTKAMLSEALGQDVELGYHVRGNQTLHSLWNAPSAGGTYTTSFGDHTVALPNNVWGFLTLQSFPAIAEPMPTLGQEVARIQDFVGAADVGAAGGPLPEIVLHAPWAGRSESAWEDWHEVVLADPTTVTNYSASYHDRLFDAVEAIYPGRVRLSSAGKVIREIRDRILAGDAPIASTADLYRDSIHLSDGLGKFAASTTIQTVILGRSQVGQPVARSTPSWGVGNVSDEQARWIQLTVWEVLLEDSRSQVTAPAEGDFDGNGVIDLEDYTLWQETFGSTERLLADANGSGVVDAADYTIWRDRYEEVVAPLSVPEPSCVMSIAFALSAIVVCRVRRVDAAVEPL